LKVAGKATKISFTHIVGFAISQAADEMPVMASSFARDKDGKPVRVEAGIHLGLAVDSKRKDGTRFLVVPVIRDAAQRTFADFVAEYERLIAAARNNELTADELQGATLTLTNPGGLGTMASVPRLMPGQGCIIATGAIGYPPEWRDTSQSDRDKAGVVKTMTMTSTYDHRVIQGAESGEFLGRIEAQLADDGFYRQLFASLSVEMPATPLQAQVAKAAAAPLAVSEKELLAAMQAATSVIKAHRTHGHLSADLDPLEPPAAIDPAMNPATVGLTPEIMEQIPASVLRVYVPGNNLAEVVPNLKKTYTGKIAYELELHGAAAGAWSALAGRYSELLGGALGIEWPTETFLADVDEGFYCACYLRAWALETHLRSYLRERFGPAWFESPEAGDVLRRLWRDGQRLDAEELLGELTGARLHFGVVLTDLGLSSS